MTTDECRGCGCLIDPADDHDRLCMVCRIRGGSARRGECDPPGASLEGPEAGGMKKVCSGCGKVLREGDESRGVSHGICNPICPEARKGYGLPDDYELPTRPGALPETTGDTAPIRGERGNPPPAPPAAHPGAGFPAIRDHHRRRRLLKQEGPS